jgi:hypothetical protein
VRVGSSASFSTPSYRLARVAAEDAVLYTGGRLVELVDSVGRVGWDDAGGEAEMGGMERFGLREGGDANSDCRRLLLGPAEPLAKEFLFPKAWISDAPKLIGRFRSGPRSGTAFSFDGVAVRFEEKVVSAMFSVVRHSKLMFC